MALSSPKTLAICGELWRGADDNEDRMLEIPWFER